VIKHELSTFQAADILEVSDDTIRRWAKAGTIPAYRTLGGQWRFNRAQLLEAKARRIQTGVA